MSREQIIATLRAHEQALKDAGVVRLSLFGSVARDEAGPDSDVDIAVRLGEGFSTGGFDYFWRLEQLQRRLSQMLGAKVDVVAEPVRKERFQSEIDRERALAF
jgi:predicted nucleotidyltransferase